MPSYETALYLATNIMMKKFRRQLVSPLGEGEGGGWGADPMSLF